MEVITDNVAEEDKYLTVVFGGALDSKSRFLRCVFCRQLEI